LTGFGSKSFSLLYRGSKHGFKNSDFHNMCDGKSNTLALIKSTTGYIFGGYRSVPWSCSGSYKSDSTAFLFTVTNPSYTPLKLNVTDSANAVYHNSGYGIHFGGSDIQVSDSSNTNADSNIYIYSYQYPEGKSGEEGVKFFLGNTNKFKSAEIEVLKVI